MAAGMSDYNSFLKHLLQDTDLQCLDPKDLAPALQIYGVINDAEHEQLTEWIKRRDDRRLVGLTGVYLLPLIDTWAWDFRKG